MSYQQALHKMPLHKITALYNQFAPICVNRFSDKENAITRISPLLKEAGVSVEALDNLVASNGNVEEFYQSVAKPDNKEVKTDKKKKSYKGKTIHLNKDCTYVYRKDSDRDVLLQKMVKANKSSFTYDEYRTLGGTSFLLKIFVNNGNVEVK